MDGVEAIKRIEDHVRVHRIGEYPHIYLKEAIDMAIDALEKQIPVEPIGDLHSVPHYRCPTCNGAVVMYCDSHKYPCCRWCGQKLDWNK